MAGVLPALALSAKTPRLVTSVTGLNPGEIDMNNLKIMRLRDNAQLPARGSLYAAGYDLTFAPDAGEGRSLLIAAGEREMVPTGLAMAIPNYHYGRVAPRSGLAVKKGLDVMAGVIDSDYRGEVKVVLVNLSNQDVIIDEGDKIAQLIIEKVSLPNVIAVETLSETIRGEGGFGSTGR